MSQASLFDASVYVRNAYDALVLAYSHAELAQIQMLKEAVLRGYVSMVEADHQQLLLGHPGEADVPF